MDSRDKDGVDEVGGTECSGGCLPGPKQWVEVAAVENRLRLHGEQSGYRVASWLELRAPGVSAGCSAMWGQQEEGETWSLSPGGGHIPPKLFWIPASALYLSVPLSVVHQSLLVYKISREMKGGLKKLS